MTIMEVPLEGEVMVAMGRWLVGAGAEQLALQVEEDE
jgi:hypothetical protein